MSLVLALVLVPDQLPPEKSAMSESKVQVCPICQVTITPAPGGDRVVFSTGPAGTRAKLWARVCQFVDKPACINRDPKLIGQVGSNDYYKTELPKMPGGSA